MCITLSSVCLWHGIQQLNHLTAISELSDVHQTKMLSCRSAAPGGARGCLCLWHLKKTTTYISFASCPRKEAGDLDLMGLYLLPGLPWCLSAHQWVCNICRSIATLWHQCLIFKKWFFKFWAQWCKWPDCVVHISLRWFLLHHHQWVPTWWTMRLWAAFSSLGTWADITQDSTWFVKPNTPTQMNILSLDYSLHLYARCREHHVS